MDSTITVISVTLLSIALVMTLFQQIRTDFWWVRFADFPHVQLLFLTVFSCLMLVISISEDEWYTIVLLGAGLVAIIYQMVILWPYTKFSRPQVASAVSTHESSNITILEANVFMDNRDYEKLTACINQLKPDLVIGLETDAKWCKYLLDAHPEYAHYMVAPLDNTYGMICMSKFKMDQKEVHYRVEEDVPSFSANLFISANEKVKLHVLHPAPPSPTENTYATERDGELLMVAREVRNLDMPVIVAGDLNDVAWSHTTRLFQRISGLLDPRIGRGLFNTYHAGWRLIRWPLDHIFHSNHFTLNKIMRCEDIGSDHFPMYISLQLAGSKARSRNEDPEASDYSDAIEANEKLNEAL